DSSFWHREVMDGDSVRMRGDGGRRRRAGLERRFVALPPKFEIVRASAHEGRVVAEMTETLVAGAAEEIAQQAPLVIMIDGEGLLDVRLQADDADAILARQHRGVALQRQSVISLQAALSLHLRGRTSELGLPIFGIRRILLPEFGILDAL